MHDLALWLTAQLDEDERIVREANTSPEMVTGIPRSYAAAPVALHIAEFADPARVLAEIDAKRLLLALHAPGETEYVDGDVCMVCEDPDVGDEGPFYPCKTLRLLAAVYADRPGYRKEWAP